MKLNLLGRPIAPRFSSHDLSCCKMAARIETVKRSRLNALECTNERRFRLCFKEGDGHKFKNMWKLEEYVEDLKTSHFKNMWNLMRVRQ